MPRTSKVTSPCGDACDWGLLGAQQLVGAAWYASQMTCRSPFPHNTQEAVCDGNVRLLLDLVRAVFKSTQTFFLETGKQWDQCTSP